MRLKEAVDSGVKQLVGSFQVNGAKGRHQKGLAVAPGVQLGTSPSIVHTIDHFREFRGAAAIQSWKGIEVMLRTPQQQFPGSVRASSFLFRIESV